jgi:curved DNA-binding protein CbpA
MPFDYYSLLEVSRDASSVQIEAAYRLQVARRPQTWWKSLRFSLARHTLRELAAAYRTLSDPRQRAEYDERLADMSHKPCVFYF